MLLEMAPWGQVLPMTIITQIQGGSGCGMPGPEHGQEHGTKEQGLRRDPPTDQPEKSRVAGLAPPCAAGRWEGRAGPQGHSVPLQHESLLGSGPRQPREASGRGSLRLAALVSNHSLVFLAGFCSFKNLNLRC